MSEGGRQPMGDDLHDRTSLDFAKQDETRRGIQ